MTLTLEKARKLIDAAFDAASEHGIAVAVAVVDRGGRVLASARSEMTGYVNLDIAEKKAVASVNFGAPTHAVLEMIKGDEMLLRSVTSQPSISLLPGGLDIRIAGELAGAIGVAGGHYTQDQSVAGKATEALG